MCQLPPHVICTCTRCRLSFVIPPGNQSSKAIWSQKPPGPTIWNNTLSEKYHCAKVLLAQVSTLNLLPVSEVLPLVKCFPVAVLTTESFCIKLTLKSLLHCCYMGQDPWYRWAVSRIRSVYKLLIFLKKRKSDSTPMSQPRVRAANQTLRQELIFLQSAPGLQKTE